jgi:hypothetical protein
VVFKKRMCLQKIILLGEIGTVVRFVAFVALKRLSNIPFYCVYERLLGKAVQSFYAGLFRGMYWLL